MSKRPIDSEQDEAKEKVKKVEKLTAAQQAKQDRLQREQEERERWEQRHAQATGLLARLGVRRGQAGPSRAPDAIRTALSAIPAEAVNYYKAKHGGRYIGPDSVNTTWDWTTDSWFPAHPDFYETEERAAVAAFASDAPGVRAGVAKYAELVTAAKLHAECVLPIDVFGRGLQAGLLDRAAPSCVLFDFVCEKHPELKGSPERPLSAADYQRCELMDLVKRVISGAHKHRVVTEPVPLPPVFQEIVDKHNEVWQRNNNPKARR